MLVVLLMLMAAQMARLVRPVVASVMPKTSVTPRCITRSLVGRCPVAPPARGCQPCLVGGVGRRADRVGLAMRDQVVAGAGGPRLRQRRVADHGHRHGPCRLRRRRPGRAGPYRPHPGGAHPFELGADSDAEELPTAAVADVGNGAYVQTHNAMSACLATNEIGPGGGSRA